MSSCIRLSFKSNQDMQVVADFIREFICSMRGINILGETRVSVDYRPQLSYKIDSDGSIEITYEPRNDVGIDIVEISNDE